MMVSRKGIYLIYLDHAATTPIEPSVLSLMELVNRTYFANPSSIYSAGQKSKVLIENARKTIAHSIGAQAGEIVFTSGGTEANNLALIGAARANIKKGNHIITSKVEHPSILETCTYLSENGFRISYIDVNNDGLLNLDQLESFLCKETILLSLMSVNNETGCFLPIKNFTEIVKDKKIIFHCDAIQAYGKIEIDINELNLDLMSLSAHKIYGPKGCGALYVRYGTEIENILYGGSQETSRRPGTENVVAIAGFAEAAKQIQQHLDSKESLKKVWTLFEKTLTESIPELEINCQNIPRVPGFSNIYFPFISGDSLLMNLDQHEIAVSTGSACSSGSQKPSHVLKAMGFDDKRINNSLRFSMGRNTTEEEIIRTIDVLKMIYKNCLKKLTKRK
jgi:cysteine desulfurase